jgi:hypothetical protein
MRPLLPLIVLALASAVASSCRCSPPNPKAVTVRVRNSTKAPILVDETTGTLGVEIQRQVNQDWFGFDEHPCACQVCATACDATCQCPDAGVDGVLRRIEAGGEAERTWDGVVQNADTQSCGAPVTCLSPENAPLNEVFRAHLCWAPVGAHFEADDAGMGPGLLPSLGRQCTDQEFRPQDGVVEVGPPKGADCKTTADCKGADELCFGGSCTAGCPGNDYPELGNNWSLLVTKGNDRGFFTSTPRGAATAFTGTGTLASVVFNGSTMQLDLTRTGSAGESLTAQLSVVLPPGFGAPLMAGTKVQVLFVDASTDDNPTNHALTLRDPTSGALLFAADVAQLGHVLTDADLAPFTVTSADAPVSCRMEVCGRLLFFVTHFAAGTPSVDLEPGKTGTLTTPSGTYTVFPVTNGAFQGTTKCAVSDARPYAVWRN